MACKIWSRSYVDNNWHDSFPEDWDTEASCTNEQWEIEEIDRSWREYWSEDSQVVVDEWVMWGGAGFKKAVLKYMNADLMEEKELSLLQEKQATSSSYGGKPSKLLVNVDIPVCYQYYFHFGFFPLFKLLWIRIGYLCNCMMELELKNMLNQKSNHKHKYLWSLWDSLELLRHERRAESAISSSAQISPPILLLYCTAFFSQYGALAE